MYSSSIEFSSCLTNNWRKTTIKSKKNNDLGRCCDSVIVYTICNFIAYFNCANGYIQVGKMASRISKWKVFFMSFWQWSKSRLIQYSRNTKIWGFPPVGRTMRGILEVCENSLYYYPRNPYKELQRDYTIFRFEKVWAKIVWRIGRKR